MLLIHSLLRRIFGHSRSGRTWRRESFSPLGIQAAQVEVLENRRLLSSLTVTTAADGTVGSLRSEIEVAHSGDTINFASSLKGQTIVLSGIELVIDKNLNIVGLGASNLAIGGGGGRVFEVDAGVQATLSGLTIEGGTGEYGSIDGVGDVNDGKGGGILNFGTLTISNCIVTGNRSNDGLFQLDLGGGIFNAGTLSLSSSTVTGNDANYGGGIYNAGTLSLSSSSVTRNFCGGDGGGIYNVGTLSLSGSSVTRNNSPYGDGGGIFNAGTLSLSGGSVTQNTATYGGGIFNDTTGTLFLSNSTVSNNHEVQGNDIYNLGTVTVTNSKK